MFSFVILPSNFMSYYDQVKCLRCHHESACYENIMDLSLEIFGWVESLEDALTQFTSPEDLDGENMYRCGRYVSLVFESHSIEHPYYLLILKNTCIFLKGALVMSVHKSS